MEWHDFWIKYYEEIEQMLNSKHDIKELLQVSMDELIEKSGLKILKKAELSKKASEIIERNVNKFK